MIYKFIARQKAEFPVNILCRVCKVSSSSYYAYLNRQDDIKARNDITDELKSKIKQSYERSRCAYGAPRIAADLNKHGTHISRAKVARCYQPAIVHTTTTLFMMMVYGHVVGGSVHNGWI